MQSVNLFQSTGMATAQMAEGSHRVNEAVSYTVSHIGLPSIELKREQLAAICFLYDEEDFFYGYQ